MKWFFATLLGLLIVLVVVFFNIPASVLPKVLDEAEVRGLLDTRVAKLTLGETSGTLWNGSSDQTTLEVDQAVLNLGELSWELDWRSLIDQQPKLMLKAQSNDLNVHGNVMVNQQMEVTVHAVEGRLPIALLEPWFPMLVQGDIAFIIDHMVVDIVGQIQALDGVLNLEYVDWLGGDNVMPLGSYIAQMSLADNKDVYIDLYDLGATLGITGFFRFNPSGYHFNALLEPRQGLAPEVAQSITWLGKKDAQGNVQINQRGRF